MRVIGNKKSIFFCAGLVLLVPVFLFFQKVRAVKIGNASQIGITSESVNLGLGEKMQVENAKNAKKTRVLFVGDMMFDRYIRQQSERKKDACFPFVKVQDFLQSFDAVIGNNEGTITDNQSVSINTTAENPAHFKFTFNQGVADCYWQNNIKAVSLGNNHSQNFGKEGVASTIAQLKQAGVHYFGDPLSAQGNSYLLDVDSLKLGLVGYNYAGGLETQEIVEQIKELKKRADVTVVFAHWGKEYETKSNPQQKELAHGFIDAGADAVIGMHPHVIQDEEIYRGKQIFYSLGNFIFDQYFRPETEEGLGVEMQISPDHNFSFKKHYFRSTRRGQVSVFRSE